MGEEAQEWRISKELTSEDISEAIAAAVAKSNFTCEHEKVGNRVDKFTIFAEDTPVYCAVVAKYSNVRWDLSQRLPTNWRELDENKRRQIGELVQAIKKEISRASDLADFAAGIPSPPFPYPPNVPMPEQQAAGPGEGNNVLQPPDENATRDDWHRYRYNCSKIGVRVPHKLFAERFVVREGTARNYYSKWLADNGLEIDDEK